MEQLFYGTSEINLDDKGRVIIPVKYRSALEPEMFVTYGSEGCIWIMTKPKWEDVQGRLRSLNLSRNVKRLFGAGEPATLDKQGRLTITAELRKHAGLIDDNGQSLSSKVTVIGAIQRIEVWHPGRWQEIADRASQQAAEYDDYDDLLAKLGL